MIEEEDYKVVEVGEEEEDEVVVKVGEEEDAVVEDMVEEEDVVVVEAGEEEDTAEANMEDMGEVHENHDTYACMWVWSHAVNDVIKI